MKSVSLHMNIPVPVSTSRLLCSGRLSTSDLAVDVAQTLQLHNFPLHKFTTDWRPALSLPLDELAPSFAICHRNLPCLQSSHSPPLPLLPSFPISPILFFIKFSRVALSPRSVSVGRRNLPFMRSVRELPFMTSILKEEGGTKKADEGTDKLREWDSDKRVQK